MRKHHEKPGTPGDILEHHGVKGMRWGVRKEEDAAGRIPTSPTRPPSGSGRITSGPDIPKFNLVQTKQEEDYHRLADGIAKQGGLDSRSMAAKYGPPHVQAQMEAQRAANQEKLKKAAIAGGVVLGAAAAGFAVYKLDQAGVINIPGGDFRKLMTLTNTNTRAYSNAVDGLKINWDKGVDLPAGSVVRRLSSVAEEIPRPDGFFAAFRDEDVDSYKAILPTFWGQWGVGSAKEGGFLNHYQAKEAIKAPSGKETFELFKHLIDTDDKFNSHFVGLLQPNGGRGYSDKVLKKMFLNSSQTWADPTNEYTKHWMKEVKGRGFNALIDFNDAGKLGKTPLRLIDGNMFDIVKNEPQSLDDFYTAAKKWTPEMIHFYLLNGHPVLIHVDDLPRVVEQGRTLIAMSCRERR